MQKHRSELEPHDASMGCITAELLFEPHVIREEESVFLQDVELDRRYAK
jgi:hypothetical protein